MSIVMHALTRVCENEARARPRVGCGVETDNETDRETVRQTGADRQ